MRQWAPWPTELESLVVAARHRRGWMFTLDDIERDPPDTHGASAGGLTLIITTLTTNSRHAEVCDSCRSCVTDYRVNFYYIVPAATWDRQTWADWLMDRVEETELHEAREFFYSQHTVLDGDDASTKIEYPFAPNHGPGRDPGRRYSYATDQDRRTSFRGVVGE